MQLQFQAPQVLKKHVVSVPTRAITLTPLAPNVSAENATSVPTRNINLVPQAPQVLKGHLVSVPTRNINLSPQAPQVIEPGATVTSVPALSITLTPQAPQVLKTHIISVPVRAIELTPMVPSVPTAADGAVTRGGWLPSKKKRRPAYERRDEEAAAFEAAVEEAYREVLGEEPDMAAQALDEVREVIAPYTRSRAKVRLPRASTIDFEALARNTEAANELLRQRELQAMDEEAVLVLLLSV